MAISLAACSGGGGSPIPQGGGSRSLPRGSSTVPLTTADAISGGNCSVSADGLVWYALSTRTFPAIDFTEANCAAPATVEAGAMPPVPAWARPSGSTQAIFVATSLQETHSLAGMVAIENLAAASGVPVTWMIGNPQYITDHAALYNQFHAANRDDVQIEPSDVLNQFATLAFPWFTPAVSIEGAGDERNIAGVIARGEHAFWGITWNSGGTDGTADRGAPWGSYCADPTSYKRPSPTGDCSLVAFEWTARDLTRSIFGAAGPGYTAEAAFSTDPDDVLLRGGFTPQTGSAYVRSIVDAYAAAGASQPIVVVSQQESHDEEVAADDPVLGAIYDEARRTGMQAMTLRDAAAAAATFSARPRAIAFPFIPGGARTSYNGNGFTPATIDYHDNAVGMTFISGHTLPLRAFEYSQDASSAFNVPLVPVAASPALTRIAASAGGLVLHFSSPAAMRFGVAIWTDPAAIGASGANVTPAGHAGFVAAFDLPAGESDQTISCACSSTTFAYSI
jgi:hypothetical protein